MRWVGQWQKHQGHHISLASSRCFRDEVLFYASLTDHSSAWCCRKLNILVSPESLATNVRTTSKLIGDDILVRSASFLDRDTTVGGVSAAVRNAVEQHHKHRIFGGNIGRDSDHKTSRREAHTTSPTLHDLPSASIGG
jgi:hypothetical protein